MQRTKTVSTGRVVRRSFRVRLWVLLFVMICAVAIIAVMQYRSTFAVTCLNSAPNPPAAASFTGSRAVVTMVHAKAMDLGLTFMESRHDVRRAHATGKLVRVRAGSDLTLHKVSHPYGLPATSLFLSRLSAQYRAACGEKLVVTSLVRTTGQNSLIPNASTRSVHPTGMAVDLRVPANATCRRWLERVLISLESGGYLEVTREKHPPHFHIAVYQCEYADYVRRQKGG
ncbi:MAG: DUF5715 family protein [Candidatus Paceibacterota bacterium]